jgi:hypothetical protein
MNKITDYVEEQSNDGLSTTYTDPATKAWVTITVDHDGAITNPVADMDGVEVAYIGHDARDYAGTIDGIEYPEALSKRCPRCNGSGNDPVRSRLYNRHTLRVTASGSLDAMCFLASQTTKNVCVEDAACTACEADGEVPATLGEYLREEYGAVAYHESSTRGYGQGQDNQFVVVITNTEWTNPFEAACGIADEYAAWARGDVYWIESSDGQICHGFIGTENARSEALTEFLPFAIANVEARREANIVRGEN